jgi:DNA-binding MarR family transcriptional regulator
MSVRPSPLLALPSYLAGQLARLARAPLQALLAEHGLVLPQYAILAALDEFGPSSQQALAWRLELDKSNVVKLLDGLERAGLAERGPSAADRRRHEVSITTAGRELVERAGAAAARRQDELLGVLSAQERAQLKALMRRVVDDHDERRHR